MRIVKCIYLCLLIISNSSYGQEDDEVKTLFLNEFDYYIDLEAEKVEIPTTYKAELDSGNKIIYEIKGKLGEGKVEIYNKEFKLLISGKYKNGLGVLSEYVTTVDLETMEQIIYIHYFYQPIPTGKWVWYDEFGEIIKEEKYSW